MVDFKMRSADTTIRELHVRAVCVPLHVPHRTASGMIMESPLVLTDVMTEDGITGHSLVFTYMPMALKPTADLISGLEALVVGQRLAPEKIHDSLCARFRLLGTQGLLGMAIAAIDMALWDALARTGDTSLVRLLGSIEKPIPAYGAVGFDGPAGSAQQAEEWAKRGFRGVKAKIGHESAKQDLEVVRAMRSAVGEDIAIMVDYNQSLTVEEAVQRILLLEDEGLTWVEEPVRSHDFHGHADVAARVKTPIQSGENWWGPLDVRIAIEAEASDYMMFEAMKIGGVTGWVRAESMAARRRIPVSNHLWPEISAQLLCATTTAHWLEYADWWNPILKEPLRVKEGLAVVGDVKGTGVEWDNHAVDRMLV
jgi:mandelate racemase